MLFPGQSSCIVLVDCLHDDRHLRIRINHRNCGYVVKIGDYVDLRPCTMLLSDGQQCVIVISKATKLDALVREYTRMSVSDGDVYIICAFGQAGSIASCALRPSLVRCGTDAVMQSLGINIDQPAMQNMHQLIMRDQCLA